MGHGKMHLCRKLAFYLNKEKTLRKMGVKIGRNCRIYNFEFGSEPYLVSIGERSHIGTYVQFITHDGGTWVVRNYLNKPHIESFGKIEVGDNVFIGNNSILLPGAKIGNNVIIGAGSIVIGTLEGNSVYAGVPAKRIRSIDDYANKILKSSLNTKGMKPKEKEIIIRQFFGL